MGEPAGPSRGDRTERIGAIALTLAALLAVIIPLSGGAWRAREQGLLGIVLAALLAAIPRTGERARKRIGHALSTPAGAALITAVALVLLDTGLLALAAPLRIAAEERLALDAILAAGFVTTLALTLASRRGATFFLDALTAGLVILAIASVVNAVRHGEGLAAGLSWPFVNHAQLGGMLATGAAIAFRLPTRSTGDAIDAAPVSLLRLGAAAFLLTTSAASQSRSAFLALAAVLTTAALSSWSPLHRASRRILAAASLVVLLAAAVFWIGAPSRWDPENFVRSGPALERRAIWAASIRLLADHPGFGTGLGSYRSAIWRETPDTVGGAIEHAHCEPLEILAERGIAGTLPLFFAGLAVACAFLRAPAVARGGTRGDPGDPATRALLGALVLPLQSCVDVVLATPGTALLSACLLGVALGARLRPRDAATPMDVREATSRRPSALALALIAAIAIPVIAPGVWALRGHARAPASATEQARLDRDDPFLALGAAAEAESEGRFEEAEREIRRAETCFPRGYVPKRALLDFFVRRDRLADALAEAQEIETGFPERAPEIAIAVATSLAAPRLAEVLAPPDPPGRRTVALWLISAGDAEGALRLLSELPAGTRTDRLALARAQIATGHTGDAARTLRALLDTRAAPLPSGAALAGAGDEMPADAEALLALVSLPETSPADAEARLRDALARPHPDPDESRLARALLSVLDRGGRIGEGDRWLDAEISRRPDDLALIEARLERRLGSNRFAEAMADAQTLIDRRPHDPRPRDLLAGIYERRGLSAGARALYREALEIAPGDPTARAALTRLESTP